MSKGKFCSIYETEFGIITIGSDGDAITDLRFGNHAEFFSEIKMSELIQETAFQLERYLLGNLQKFDIPLNLTGTEFQKKVWHALSTIPYGETRSYKQIAEMIGNPKACRAVGMANNRNPAAIIIPCHRVIGTNGKLVGYGGGMGVKQFLLDLEDKYKS